MTRTFPFTCDFSFVEMAPRKYKADYKIYNEDNIVIYEDSCIYMPKTAEIKDNNDARKAVGQYLRVMFKAWYGIKKGIQMRCSNDPRVFLTKGEKCRATRALNREVAMATCVAAPSLSDESRVDPTKDNRRVYEVVKVGDVWTIKKHDTELLNEQEAKTQLFAHIVNGD